MVPLNFVMDKVTNKTTMILTLFYGFININRIVIAGIFMNITSTTHTEKV